MTELYRYVKDHLSERRRILKELLSIEKERSKAFKTQNERETLERINNNITALQNTLRLLLLDVSKKLSSTKYSSIAEIIDHIGCDSLKSEKEDLVRLDGELRYQVFLNQVSVETVLRYQNYILGVIFSEEDNGIYDMEKARKNKKILERFT